MDKTKTCVKCEMEHNTFYRLDFSRTSFPYAPRVICKSCYCEAKCDDYIDYGVSEQMHNYVSNGHYFQVVME